MATIDFYNVQHGEYITIDMKTDEGEPLLVIRDFGAYPQTLNTFLKSEASSIVKRPGTKDVVLSHAHKDHTNGFFFMHESLSKSDPAFSVRPFRNTFIPYLRYKDAKDLGALMLKVGLFYLVLLPTTSPKSGKISNWIKTTPIMYDLSDRLIGVKEGVMFPGWEQNGTVLWPPKSDSDYYKEQIDFLNETARILLAALPQGKSNSIMNTYEDIRKVLMQLEGNGQTRTITKAYEIVNSHLETLLRLCHASKTPPARTPLDKKRRDKFLDSIDNHSIVFSLGTKDNADGILFLSDLCERPMDLMSKYWGIKTYKYIKSAHHGSRLGKPFAKKVKADTIIHCCGDGNASYHGPEKSYLSLGSTNLCSDWAYNSKWQNRGSFTLFNADKYTITI